MADPGVEIRIKADASQVAPVLDKVGEGLAQVAGKQGTVTDATKKTGEAVAQTGDKQNAAADAAEKGATRQVASHRQINDGVKSISAQLDNVKEQFIAFTGINLGAGMVKDAIATADAFKNLEARIKLTTGEGHTFTEAFSGVVDIAKRTSSNLEQTGTLFAKLTEAGKSSGLATQAAIAQSLRLTETINQAIQLSGGSAESAKASITQLIQGLQSGVLRGDEFNSVMEQSPRLAKALADGLGLTTGELRAMAEAGALSSATVIKALKSQSEALQTEFATLPATVGRAVENLQTQWQLYIGDLDKSKDITGNVAKAIGLLADNLTQVITVAKAGGAAWAGYAAYQKLMADGVQDVTAKLTAQSGASAGAAAATKAQSAVQLEATAAATAYSNAETALLRTTAARKAASLEATTATAVHVKAQIDAAVAAKAYGDAEALALKAIVAQGAASTQAAIATKAHAASLADAAQGGFVLGTATGPAVKAIGAQADAATAATSRFAGMGAALGNLAGKLGAIGAVGYGLYEVGKLAFSVGDGLLQRLSGLTAAEKKLADQEIAQKAAIEAATRAREQQTAAAELAVAKTFDLSKAAVNLIAKFDELVKKGDSAATAIASIGKDFDLANVKGIKDAGAVLDKLSADGKLSAGELKAAWANALKTEDLEVFATKAQAAFAGSARGAERLAQIAGAQLQEAVRRTGLDFDTLAGGMSKASKSALNDTESIIKGLDRLKAEGINTAQVLTASLGKGINTADSQKAIEAVRQQIESARKALGDKLADGLLEQAKQKALELSDALDKAKPGINSLREAMKELGLKTREELQATATKATEAYDTIRRSGQQEGESYVAWQHRKHEAAAAMIQRLIEANGGLVNDAIRTRAAMEGIELAVDSTGRTTVKSMGDASSATDQLRKAADGATDSFARMGDAASQAADAAAKANATATAEKYSGPKYGSTLTKDNMRGVDNTGLYDLEQKRSAGNLGKSDLAQAEAVYRAAMVNVDVFQKNQAAFSTEGAKSIMDTAAKAKALLDQVKSFEVGGRAPAAAPIAAAPTPAPTPAPSPSPTPAAPAPSPTAPVAGTATPSAASGASDAALVRLTNSINNLDYTINQFASQLSRAAPSSAGNDWLSNLAKAKANSGL